MGRWRAALSRRDGGGDQVSKRAFYPRLRLSPDVGQHPFKFVTDIQGPDPNDPDAFSPEPGRSPRIVRYLVGLIVGRTVHLNRQLRGRAVKIQNVRPDWMLFAKTQPAELITLQAAPQPRFGRCKRPSESASTLIADPVRHPVAPSVTALKERRATSPFAKRRTGRRRYPRRYKAQTRVNSRRAVSWSIWTLPSSRAFSSSAPSLCSPRRPMSTASIWLADDPRSAS